MTEIHKINVTQATTATNKNNGTQSTKKSDIINFNFTNEANNETICNNSASQKLSAKVNELLGVPYLKGTIVKNSDGKIFLRITRNENDSVNPNKRGESCLGAIKDKLGIKDHVISAYNDPATSTGRRTWSDSATIDPGRSIDIPVSALGEAFTIFKRSDYKALRQLKANL